MKAFKASFNGRCETLTYEVGKTYTFNGPLKLCKRGFHCCKNLKDVFKYYDLNRDDLVIFEVEVLGKIIEAEDKLVTDKLKIVRVLNKNEYNQFLSIKKFDKNNNCIYYKNSNGQEFWKEFNQNNNLIHYKNNMDYEEWYEYDQNNNLIHYRNSNGSEYWSRYNNHNELIAYKDNYSEWSITIE